MAGTSFTGRPGTSILILNLRLSLSTSSAGGGAGTARGGDGGCGREIVSTYVYFFIETFLHDCCLVRDEEELITHHRLHHLVEPRRGLGVQEEGTAPGFRLNSISIQETN